MVKKNSYFKGESPEKHSLNLKEAAAYLGRAPRIIRNLAKTGVIPCQFFQNGKSTRKTYFFSTDALDRWQDNNGKEAGV